MTARSSASRRAARSRCVPPRLPAGLLLCVRRGPLALDSTECQRWERPTSGSDRRRCGPRRLCSRLGRGDIQALRGRLMGTEHACADLVREQPSATGEHHVGAVTDNQAGLVECSDAVVHLRKVGVRAFELDPSPGAQRQHQVARTPRGRGRAPRPRPRPAPPRRPRRCSAPGCGRSTSGGDAGAVVECVPVGGAADPRVFAALPVEEVVAALLTRHRPVGDLVPLESGRAEALVGEVVGRCLGVVVGSRPFARRHRLTEGGAGLRP